MKMILKEGTLITYALGSCIGISFYDPVVRLAALLHIMLPESKNLTDQRVFKFADTGIQETLQEMAFRGGVKSRYICKIAGGARMFEVQGTSNIANIGQRNIESVHRILAKENIPIFKQEVGENYARTMKMDAKTGQVMIHTYGRDDIFM